MDKLNTGKISSRWRNRMLIFMAVGVLVTLFYSIYLLAFSSDKIWFFLLEQQRASLELSSSVVITVIVSAISLLCLYQVSRYKQILRKSVAELYRLQIRFVELDRSVYLDNGTGLANRFKFLEMLDARMVEGKGNTALCILDLDDLKNINDTLGHNVGDQVISIIAQRIKLSLERSLQSSLYTTNVYRIGGDEFAILIMGVSEAEDIAPILNQLLKNVRRTIELSGECISVGVSIGVSISPEHGECSDSLLKKADMAMYKVKESGKHGVAFFKPEYMRELEYRVRLEQELNQALINGEFEIYYQPVIDISTGKELGFEALIRWHHPIRGLVPPDDFIPVAEQTGLIVPMGQWIIKQVCSDLSLLQVTNPGYFVAINIAPQQLADHGFVQNVRAILAYYSLTPTQVHFEITETTLMNAETDNLRVLRELNNLGIKLWIDDFGTGYSSFSYLHKFQFYGIKLDRSFIEGVVDSERSQNIVKGICAMGHALKLELLGEGIEQPEQAEFLLKQGCYKVQGYWYAKPMSLSTLNMWLASRKENSVIETIDQPSA
ncbi:MAG: EAL domain-containing protein [Moritella sp.]|uniref:putative bifunctional diguanylate cyclase/phosphodiesterase n=1 Tax=Moritella sp. TaxID=78556 RepID=UPI0029A6A4E6|nr:EAL domain-containing protein [Moritella sp.]MDX2318966.1 EAL domain-containing protein [Moritella sp.]